ncbi:MAG: choice-of-anchor tandem repeat GloVer-containing protein [Bryobacteraceae bacterium]
MIRSIAVIVATAIAVQAQTLTIITNFTGPNGYGPGTLLQANDGNFYGITPNGGSIGNGTIFKLTPAGQLTTLYNLVTPDIQAPLIQAMDGNLYGTTGGGGNRSDGTIFEFSTAGNFITLYAPPANNSLGVEPNAPLVQGQDGSLYGTMYAGGKNDDGTVFKLTLPGTFNTLYNFSGADGVTPYSGLMQAADGNFYGTTGNGGAGGCNEPPLAGCGTIFRITPGGSLTTLYSFGAASPMSLPPSDGSHPGAELVQGTDGNFYGTTGSGGAFNLGTVFKITPGGALTTLYSFTGAADGEYPGGLVQASDGNFYGMSGGGSISGCVSPLGASVECGTVFSITPAGKLTTLHSFGANGDGASPNGSLIQASDGNLYGSTYHGGTDLKGTVFRLTLPPSNVPAIATTGGVLNGASFQPAIGADSWITIKGSNLAPLTDNWNNAIVNGVLPASLDGVRVMMGDQPAYIEYVSSTQINALAPNVAAGTFPVTVTTSIGTSQAVMVDVAAVQPAFFQWGNYVVATRQDFSLAVKNGTFPATTTVPAAPGEVIILWGTGFGPTSPSAPEGVEAPATATYNTATAVTVTVGNQPAKVYGAALAPGYAGLYQVAIEIPGALTNGDYPVVATVSGAQSSSTTLITVQQ